MKPLIVLKETYRDLAYRFGKIGYVRLEESDEVATYSPVDASYPSVAVSIVEGRTTMEVSLDERSRTWPADLAELVKCFSEEILFIDNDRQEIN